MATGAEDEAPAADLARTPDINTDGGDCEQLVNDDDQCLTRRGRDERARRWSEE